VNISVKIPKKLNIYYIEIFYIQIVWVFTIQYIINIHCSLA